jgi:hypothetical protein
MTWSFARRNRGRLAAAVVGLGVAAVTVGVNPAVAQAGNWGCQDGFSCYYDGEYGAGRKWVAPSCGFFNLGDPNVVNPVFNDKITSITNGSNHSTITLYNYIGGGKWDNLGTMAPGDWSGKLKESINNKIDAVDISC